MAENYDDNHKYFQGVPSLLYNTLTFPHLKNLKKGVSGSNIVVLQKLLEEFGFYKLNVKYKWTFDDEVEAAVKKFQKAYGLVVDGVAGPVTIKKLNSLWYLKRGDTPPAYIYDGVNSVGAQITIKDWEPLDFQEELKVHVEFLHHFWEYDVSLIGVDPGVIGGYGTTVGIASVSFNVDIEAFSAEATVKLRWDKEEDIPDYTSIGQAVRLTIKTKRGEQFFVLVGYVSNMKMEQSNNEIFITYTIKQNNSLDINEIWGYNKTQYRSAHINELLNMTALDYNWNLEEFDDEIITISTENSTGDTTSSGNAGGSSNATKTVSECFDMAKPFIHPSHDHKYETGSSTHDPETAWNAYQNGTRHFDCFGCSAFLFYVISNFAKKAVRVIHRYSASAGSGTHYTVQLKNDSGEWYDPRDEYRKLDSFLRVNSGPILQVHQVFEG